MTSLMFSGDSRQPEKPLIRVRVEYTCEREMFNAVRFGLQYADKVANPSEIVLFRKQRSTNKDKAESDLDKNSLQSIFTKEEVSVEIESVD